MTGRSSRALVLAVTVSLLAMTTIVRADAASAPPEPDVYEQELSGFGSTIVATATGVPLFIGAATTPLGGLVSISSMGDFDALITAPSPMLLAGVQQFYDQGGGDAFVLTVTTEDAPTFSAALGAAASGAPGWDLIVIPALGSLTPTDWLAIATQMTATAGAAQATALLDPPDATVAAAQTAGAGPLTALAQDLRAAVLAPTNAVRTPANALLLSSGLMDDDANPVSGAATVAGLITSADLNAGVWEAPGGPGAPLVGGLQPVLIVDDVLDASLDLSVNRWRVLPGAGTMLWGARTLVMYGPGMYVNTQRTPSWVDRSITPALQPYVFEPNDGATWSAIDASISSFLTGLWGKGALAGESASEAFTVNVGVPTTMTGQDVLDGVMVVVVEITIALPSEPVTLRFEQQMAT